MLRWIRNWWNADRIRVTPGHSRLFHLTVGSRVLVRDRLWVVLDRLETSCEDQPSVLFTLDEFDEPQPISATLRIGLGEGTSRLPTADWSEPGWCDSLLDGDIIEVNAL